MTEPLVPSLALRGRKVDLTAPLLMTVVEGTRPGHPDVLATVEASEASVIAAALAAGAVIVDPRRGCPDPEVVRLCAEARAGLVVGPGPHPGEDLVEVLSGRLAELVDQGVAREATILDPGSVPGQGLLDRLRQLGRPLVFTPAAPDLDGVAGMLAAVGHLAAPGTILRVRPDDVDAVSDYLAVAGVLAGWTELAPDVQLPVHLRREPRS